ncbi:MAG: T9SS type A sorting domain-containing protein [Flavobacteriales bacterium]|nr:T9SS type A sorting domain-containing protein [Flavobacteriales bacterium]
MKKQLLFLIIFIAPFYINAQVIFGITSNLCDSTTEHTYNYQYAGELDGSSTDWNTPNMLIDSNAIQGCLVLVNDGSTPGIGTAPYFTIHDACDSATWTQDLTGKIAVFYRGACEFGIKAYNAQKRGAIGAIIINNNGAAVGMAGGTYGVNVTIPYWMIGETDGAELVACLDTVCTGVTGYFGNEFPSFADDMSSSKSLMLMTESSAIPWDLASTGAEYPMDFGIWVYNNGWDAQNGVTVTVEVERSGVVEFTNTSTTLNFNAPDTTFLDSQYVDLGTYAPANWTIGTYTITYIINNNGDENLANNVFSFEFKLTNNEDVYAKCRLDNSNKPIHNTAYALNETILWNEFESCITFRSSIAGDRNTTASGLTFSCEPVWGTMANEFVTAKVYEWNDVFVDINSPATFNSLNLLDQGSFSYMDESLNGINIYVPFTNPVFLQNNQRYLFCLNILSDSLRMSYDTYDRYDHPEGIDYSTTINHYLQSISPVGTNSGGSGWEWYTAGFGYDNTAAISVTMDIATGINDLENEQMLSPYPNPANNLLMVPIRKNKVGNVQIQLLDLAGKLVLTANKKLNNEAVRINVASISNGNYLMKLTFEDNTQDVFKISVNR